MNNRNYKPAFDSIRDTVLNAIVKYAESTGSGIDSVNPDLAAAIASAVINHLELQEEHRNHAQKFDVWEALIAGFTEGLPEQDPAIRNLIFGILRARKNEISDAVLNVINKKTPA